MFDRDKVISFYDFNKMLYFKYDKLIKYLSFDIK
jgi:hypothetical protein